MDKLSKTWLVAALLGLCALIFFLRLHTYEEPLERDLTTYAVIAHEMLGGKKLYSDLWDHKPPAIHVTYAAAEAIAGYGRDSIFLMNVAAALATLLACYFAGSAGGGWPGGLVAASLWALASGDLALEGNQPNTEVFLNACLAWGFAIFLRAKSCNLGSRAALLAGLLFAVASLYKQVVVAQAALLAFAYVAWPPTDSRKRALADIGIVAAVGLAAWGTVLGYFYTRGRGAAFTEAVFTYNHFYSNDGWKNSLAPGAPPVSPDVVAVLLSLAVLSVAGLVLGLIFGPRRQWVLLLAFAIATHISVLLPGWFFAHYYQLWLPPLVIGAGWSVILLKRILPERVCWLSYAAGATACATLVILEAPYYQVGAEIWSIRKYGNIFVDTDRLARRMDSLLSPQQTFYEWGRESGLYFTSRRRPPSGLVFTDPMLAGPIAAKLSRRLIDDLERTKPDLIVVADETLRQTHGHPVLNWIEENYRPFSRTNSFTLMARKGGQLACHKPIAAN